MTTCATIEICVKEVVRFIDVYLLKYNCPECGDQLLTGVNAFCEVCGWDEAVIFDISKATNRNAIEWVQEKRRGHRRLGKKAKRAMLEMQDGRCAYCVSELFGVYEVEHVIPVCAGGSLLDDNIVLSCRSCNASAGGKVFQDFYEKQRYILNKKLKAMGKK